jgi:hypothetical protein
LSFPAATGNTGGRGTKSVLQKTFKRKWKFKKLFWLFKFYILSSIFLPLTPGFPLAGGNDKKGDFMPLSPACSLKPWRRRGFPISAPGGFGNDKEKIFSAFNYIRTKSESQEK